MNPPTPLPTLLARALLAPWRSSRPSLPWLTLIIALACALGAVALGVFGHHAHWWLGSAVVYAFGMGYLWAFWMPTLLLLAIDARRLRLPGVERTSTHALWLYAVPSLLLPVLALGAFGADLRYVVEVVALAMAGGTAFVLLPRWCAMIIGFMPALSIGARHLLQLPSWSDPRWLVWGALLLALLLLVDALRWRQLLRSDSENEVGLASAMLMQFRRQGVGGWNGLQQLDASQLVRQRPDWMQPRADLRKAGPAEPVQALRVALGGWYVPKTLAGHLRAAAPVLLPILLYIPVMAFMQAGEARSGRAVHAALTSMSVGLVGWLGVFGGLMLAAMAAMVIHQRWKRVNAELPLLALLPGLGHGQAQRRWLLRAVFGVPLRAQALLLACVLVGALTMHVRPLALALLLLAQLAAVGTMTAQLLCTLGGRSPGVGAMATLYVVLVVWFCISTFVPLISGMDKTPWSGLLPLELTLLAGWAVMAVVLGWLGRRGWRGLLARAHPFLAN